MTDEKRNCMSLWILRSTLAFMVTGCLVSAVAGQSQDFVNATATERMNAADRRISVVEARLDRLDDKLMAGLVGLVANLAVHLLQLGRKK